MGAGRYSKIAKDGNRGTSSTSKETSELRTKRYIRKALELGLSSGYLTPDDNSDGQVLRVASEIVKFGRPKEDGSGSDELQDETEGVRGRPGKNVGRAAAGKRLAMKKGRTNLGKRGRSRTKSPKKQIAQKRRRKRSDNRTKVKARIQKRKRASGVKNDEPRTRKSDKAADDDEDDNDADDDVGDDVDPDNDNGNGKDEDDEPDVTNNGDENSNGDNKKLPVSGKPGNVVTNTEKNLPTNAEKKSDDGDEASGNEAASSDDEEEEVEDDDEDEQTEEGLANEADGNDDNDGQKVED